jgi:hypothetical protein
MAPLDVFEQEDAEKTERPRPQPKNKKGMNRRGAETRRKKKHRGRLKQGIF